MLHYPVAIWDPGYMESWLYGILARAGGGILAIWNPGYAVVPRTVRTGTYNVLHIQCATYNVLHIQCATLESVVVTIDHIWAKSEKG